MTEQTTGTDSPPKDEGANQPDRIARQLAGNATGAWQDAANIAVVAGLIFTLLGAGWAVFEYRARVESERASRTISYIDLWESGGYQGDLKLLQQAWSEFLSRIPDNQREDAASNPALMNNLKQRYYSFLDERTIDQSAVERVTYFFNRLSICVEANVCSEKVARAFFAELFDSFAGVFDFHIESNRGRFPGDLSRMREMIGASSI